MCRAVADKLASAANCGETVILPGWDYANVSPDEMSCCAVRRAAKAIVGTENLADGATVARGDWADLIRYIADMLEE